MTKPKRPNFSPEFRLEAALLVVDQGYTVRDAAEAMGVGKSTMDKWVDTGAAGALYPAFGPIGDHNSSAM